MTRTAKTLAALALAGVAGALAGCGGGGAKLAPVSAVVQAPTTAAASVQVRNATVLYHGFSSMTAHSCMHDHTGYSFYPSSDNSYDGPAHLASLLGRVGRQAMFTTGWPANSDKNGEGTSAYVFEFQAAQISKAALGLDKPEIVQVFAEGGSVTMLGNLVVVLGTPAGADTDAALRTIAACGTSVSS